MKYNLARYSQTISNVISGTISLTTDEVITLITSTTATIAVPASGILVVDSDLGSRIHLDEIQYYFHSTESMDSVASGIKFYYKNESFETYTGLVTYYNSNYYYTVLSGTNNIPRYIRIEHTITSSGFVNGLQILNDDTYVDFGKDGTDIDTNFNLSLDNDYVEINETFVFNNGPIKANAKIFIEPQGTIADDVLYISDSSNGPWYGIYNDVDKISGAGLWDTGSYYQSEIVGSTLKLSSGYTEGTYKTRIVKLNDNQQLTFNTINYYYPTTSGKSIIATDVTDTLDNIEVKSSNYRPLDRDTYIWASGSYSSSTKFTNHSWVVDGTLAEQSSDWGSWGRSSNFFEYWYDSVREDEYIVDKPFYTGYYGNTTIYFRVRRKDGSLYSTTIANSDYDTTANYNTYKLSPNIFGGFWIYYYLYQQYGSTEPRYRLSYYDPVLNRLYTRYTNDVQGSFLYDMDTVYNSDGDLWYTDRDLSTVFKINTAGTILASYLATEDIRGLFTLEDGGCWFIQAQSLIRLDNAGQFVESIELSSSTASYVYSDMDGGFWLQDGWIIRHLRSDGTEYFNIEVPNLYWISVMNSGVITKQHDGSTTVKPTASYISKYSQRIVRTWDYPRTEGGYKGTFDYNRLGVRSQAYNDLVDDHASNFPIAIDDQWNIHSEWSKVSLRDYNFTNNQYHQLRITLRADDSSNSPEVYGIYNQRAIEVPDVYPNNYGKFYLKSDISTLSSQDVGDYTSKVRAYWFLPTE